MAEETNKNPAVLTPTPPAKPNNPDDRVPVVAPPTTTKQVPVGQFGKTTTVQEDTPAKNPDGSDKLPKGAIATRDVPLASQADSSDTREQAVAVTPEGHAANKPGMSAH